MRKIILFNEAKTVYKRNGNDHMQIIILSKSEIAEEAGNEYPHIRNRTIDFAKIFRR